MNKLVKYPLSFLLFLALVACSDNAKTIAESRLLKEFEPIRGKLINSKQFQIDSVAPAIQGDSKKATAIGISGFWNCGQKSNKNIYLMAFFTRSDLI